jgi:hypothetical protein
LTFLGTASRIDINGKKSLTRPKYSMIEVVEPEEEEVSLVNF